MEIDLIKLFHFILFTLIIYQYVLEEHPSRVEVSAVVVDKRRFTGYGTYIENMTANSKLPKYARVDVSLKQRVLTHFFKVEGVNKTEIQRRLNLRFGGHAIDLRVRETTEELERRRHLHYNVVERIIIQFLNAERVRPAEIFKRLRKVSDHGQHWCNVYRWVYKFRKGRTDVANIPCVRKPKHKPKAAKSNSTIKLSKCAKIDNRIKKTVLLRFLRAENISESEIDSRLKRQFGNETLDDEASKLHPSVVDRIIIQFLHSEGVRPVEIIRRLTRLNLLQGRHRCFVYKWVSKFKEGRSDVENYHWTKKKN